MRLKKHLEFSTSDFWYDITDGGVLDPNQMCTNKIDAEKVVDAIEILKDFQNSCEDQIEGFLQ
jgi:hypothetical protein